MRASLAAIRLQLTACFIVYFTEIHRFSRRSPSGYSPLIATDAGTHQAGHSEPADSLVRPGARALPWLLAAASLQPVL